MCSSKSASGLRNVRQARTYSNFLSLMTGLGILQRNDHRLDELRLWAVSNY